MSRTLVELTEGFGFLLSGTRMIFKDRSLFLWAIIPFLIDLALVAWGISWGVTSLSSWTAATIGYLVSPSAGIWYDIFYYPLLVIFWLAFLVVLTYGTFLIATIIASPFNSLLAERALVVRGVIEDRPFHFGRWLKVTLKMIFVSILRALIFLAIGVIILILSFIPVLNVLGSYMAFLIMAFDSMDYSFEALEYDLADRFKYFRNHFAEFSGMAAALGLTLLIPGLTLLLLPSAVVGCADIVHRVEKKSLKGNS